MNIRTFWLLGLPIDSLDLQQARRLVIDAAHRRHAPLVFATPNSSFLTLSAGDDTFYRSILDCNLSLADGMPLVWLARLLKLSLPERVAGSSLFESLAASDLRPPVRTFFFGGPPGAAEAANAAYAGRTHGITGVGAMYPAFGSLASMSSDEVIDSINFAKADFLVVALGAAKGHAWIQRNRDRLASPVISHLGAVVNFAAGTLKRAPLLVQRIGFEWLWRLATEPRLARRYAGDAAHLARLLLFHVLPLRTLPRAEIHSLVITRSALTPGLERWKLEGSLVSETAETLMSAHAVATAQECRISELDVSGISMFDPEGLGALYRLVYRGPPTSRPQVRGKPLAWRDVTLHRAEILFPDAGQTLQ